MFERLEQARVLKGVATYTLGQTTLEQVFNQFAATQEEETDSSRGIHHQQVVNTASAPTSQSALHPVQNWRLATTK
jgi:hypothetical protein